MHVSTNKVMQQYIVYAYTVYRSPLAVTTVQCIAQTARIVINLFAHISAHTKCWADNSNTAVSNEACFRRLDNKLDHRTENLALSSRCTVLALHFINLIGRCLARIATITRSHH